MLLVQIRVPTLRTENSRRNPATIPGSFAFGTAKSSFRRWRILAAAVILAVLLAGCNENMRASYETYAEAEADGAISRGWIPAYVPPSATQIMEVHNLDVNTQRIRFNAPLADLQLMVEGMRMVPRSELPKSTNYLPPIDGDWIGKSGTSLRFYVAINGGAARCVAVDWKAQRAYGWSC